MSRTKAFFDLAYLPVLVVLALVIFVTSLLVSWPLGGGDDAYITYTFARNIAQGEGFVWYEGGPHVYGSTTLTYTLTLALLGWAGIKVPVAGVVVGALSWAGAYLALFYLLKRNIGKVAGLLVLALGAVSVVEVVLSVGMETGLYVFLIFLTFALYVSGRPTGALLLSVGVVLTRPDGVLIPVLIFIHYLLTHGGNLRDKLSNTLRSALPSVLVMVLFLAGLTWYFGNPIPLSLRAKATFNGNISSPFELSNYLGYLPTIGGIQSLVVVFLLIAVLGMVRAVARWRDPTSLVVLWVPLYIGIFYLSEAPGHLWYYAATIPGLYAAFAWGANWPPHYLRELRRHQENPPSAPDLSFPVVLAVAFALTFATVFAANAKTSYERILGKPLGPLGEKALSAHEARLAKLAPAVVSDMKKRGTENPDVVAFEVGHMGYMIPGRVHDILGLVSPDALRHGGYKNPLYLVRKYNPEYVVIAESRQYPPTAPIIKSRSFRSNYTPVYSLPRGKASDYTVFFRGNYSG